MSAMLKEEDVGTLYVLANRDNTLAKVGLTRNGTPDVRADSYSREHGFHWRVYWQATTCHVGEAEARAHRALRYCRWTEVPGAREIFYTTPAKAKAVAAHCVVAPRAEQVQRDATAPIHAAEQPQVTAADQSYLEWKSRKEAAAEAARCETRPLRNTLEIGSIMVQAAIAIPILAIGALLMVAIGVGVYEDASHTRATFKYRSDKSVQADCPSGYHVVGLNCEK